jgi:lysophospholipase L1-like esterase
MGGSPQGTTERPQARSSPFFEESVRDTLGGVAGSSRRAAVGETLRRSLLVSASLLFSFLALEIALGVVPRPGSVLNVYNRRMTTGLDCYPTNPRGYFDLDLRDDVTRERFESLQVQHVERCVARAPYAVELLYNSLQFRDREPGPQKLGVHRIAVLGDSFTEGQGVKERDAYPRVLERALNAAGTGQWEVLNFGRRGANFPALNDNFEELLRYDPDVVVYGMMLNDCEPSPAFQARHPLVTSRMTRPRRRPAADPDAPFGLRTAFFVQDRLEQHQIDRAMRAWYSELWGAPNREGWERCQAYIEDMNGRMRLRGGHFLLATWPVLAHLDREYPFEGVHETLGRFCHGAGIPWLDLFPALKGRSAADLWVHPLDPHPNASAHGRVAEGMADAVRRLVEGD